MVHTSNRAGPRGGVRPRYSGLRVQGTASSPSSTTNMILPQRVGFCQCARVLLLARFKVQRPKRACSVGQRFGQRDRTQNPRIIAQGCGHQLHLFYAMAYEE